MMPMIGSKHKTMRTIVSMIAALLVVSCSSHPLKRAREQVAIGVKRKEAIQILNQEAWYHQPCPNRITIDDLFFFNSHDYEKADVVIVRSEPDDDTFRVYQIGTFEIYAWQAAYKDCVERDRFE